VDIFHDFAYMGAIGWRELFLFCSDSFYFAVAVVGHRTIAIAGKYDIIMCIQIVGS